MEKRYIVLDVFTSGYSQPDCNVCKGKTMFIEAERGNISEEDVTRYEAEGSAIVLVEGKAGDRIHLKPRGDNRWLMFGGTFAYSSDSRFPYDRPVHIHDRYEG